MNRFSVAPILQTMTLPVFYAGQSTGTMVYVLGQFPCKLHKRISILSAALFMISSEK